MKHRNLVVDLYNQIFMIRYATLKTPAREQRKEPMAMEVIFFECFNFILKIAKEHKCDSILIACDSPNVWRKSVYPDYKNSDHDDIYYEDAIGASNMIMEVFSNHSNAGVVRVPESEADDIIALFCNESEGVENIILSNDKDFVQLLSSTTRQYAPQQKKFRESEDPEFDLFMKCIRGDKSDNIASAFPRVREKVIKDAWDDPLAIKNLLETVRSDGKKVNEVFEFNRQLIDLKQQPDYIKDAIRREIAKPVEPNFSDFSIQKYLAEVGLKEKAKSLDFQLNALKKPPVWKADSSQVLTENKNESPIARFARNKRENMA